MSRLIDSKELITNIYCIACSDKDVSVKWLAEYIEKQPTVSAIPLEKVKAARESISDFNIREHYFGSDSYLIGIANGMDKAVEILDKLIAESENDLS